MRRNSPFTRQFTQRFTRYSHPGQRQTGRRTRWAAIALLAALTTACGGTPDTAEPLNSEPAAERPAPEADVATDSEAEPRSDVPAAGSNTTTAREPIALPPEAPTPEVCDDLQTQQDMTRCEFAIYEQVEQQQEATYRALFNAMDEVEQTYLVESERDWVLFRDAHCEFVASRYEGGSMQPMVQSTCLATVTRDRMVALVDPMGATTFDAADDNLNRTYQTLKSSFSSADQETLIDVQLLWLDYRDSTCHEAITPRVGRDGNVNQCLAKLSEQRTAELQAQVEQQQL